MIYPTMEQVDAAGHRQLCIWMRFLQGPEVSTLEDHDVEKIQDSQVEILDRIIVRYHDLGGMTTAISKEIGWDESRY